MPRPPKSHFEPSVEADLFAAYEDVRRAYSTDIETFLDCTTLRDWVILFLRTSGRLFGCASWAMSNDSLLSRKMRDEMPDALTSLTVVLIAWRIWWHKQ